MMKLLIAAVIVCAVTVGAYLYRSQSSSPQPRAAMTEADAREIAERTCIKGGEALGAGSFNANSRTWWFDANLNATRPGCSPACVVSEGSRTVEINWRCTGLIVPSASPTHSISPVMCTADAMQCPDGTWVGRTGPRCEFVCP